VEKYFNPDLTYDEAIKKGEVGVLRALLTGIIGSDPTFATTEFDEACEYIKDKSVALNGKELVITEDYQKQEDEYETEERQWDEHYFQMNLLWLRDNFCLTERLNLIKKMGKKVYENKNTLGKSKERSRSQAVEDSCISRNGLPDSKKVQAVRTAGGGGDKNDRLSGNNQEMLKRYWCVALIIFVLAILVLIGVKVSKNIYRVSTDSLVEHKGDEERKE